MEHFGSSFTTLKVNDLKLPDQAWHSNDLFGYVERLLRKLSTSILVVEEADKEIANKGSGNNTRTARGAKKKGITQASAKIDRLELPLNKTGTEFSGTVRNILNFLQFCHTLESLTLDQFIKCMVGDEFTSIIEVSCGTVHLIFHS